MSMLRHAQSIYQRIVGQARNLSRSQLNSWPLNETPRQQACVAPVMAFDGVDATNVCEAA